MNDPEEQANLIGVTENAETVVELQKLLDEWWKVTSQDVPDE